ncbi:hypothetical protein OSTOST_01145, partial [Ostertagia ostertagi]
MDDLSYFNRTYMSHLNQLYKIWSDGYTTEEFFNLIQEKYGYACDELFRECQLAGKIMNCCSDLFERQVVMRRGICFQTRKFVNQTEADDIGRIILSLKAPPSITNPYYNFTQPQIIVYITDNFNHVVDFPRFYLYPHEWNRMRFTARYIALIESEDVCTQRPQIIVYITDNFNHVVDFPRFYLYPHEWNRMRFTARYIALIESEDVCTQRIFGKDAECVIRKWLLSNIVYPFNCTLSYLTDIGGLPPTTGVCKPEVIAENYYNNIQLVWNSASVNEEVSSSSHVTDPRGNQVHLQFFQALFHAAVS